MNYIPEDYSYEPEIEEDSVSRNALSYLKETVEVLLMAVVMVLVINLFTARIRVEGYSMEPTFQHNNFVIVNRMAYSLGEIERGDVIVFPYPENPEEDYIKRVIGLPGDHVLYRDKTLYINGEAMKQVEDEAYALYEIGGDARFEKRAEHLDGVIHEILVAAEGAANLTSQLLAFSGRQVQQQESVDVAATVTKLEGLLRRLLHANVELCVRCDGAPHPAKGDPVHNPMSQDEILTKFRTNVEFSKKISKQKAEELLETLLNLDKLDSVGKLIPLLLA